MPNTFNMFSPQKKLKRKKYLVEFRAGKMKLEKNNWVYPDKRKGLVFLHQTTDGRLHFCWKDRVSDKVEDDVVVFPQETIFKRLPECTTGRVYLLKTRNSKKLFLWMQEPKEEKDAEFCRRVNNFFNQTHTETITPVSKDLNINEFTNLLGQLNEIGALNEIDLMEILGLTHDIETHATADTEMSNLFAPSTNPFQIGSNTSAPTLAERISDEVSPNDTKATKEVLHNQHSTRMELSSLTSQNTNDGLDPNLIFSEATLIQLSQNNVFKSQVLSIADTEENNVLDIRSEQFKIAIRDFGNILSDRNMGLALLSEMGVPDNIINKQRGNDIASLLHDLEDYYNRKKNNNP